MPWQMDMILMLRSVIGDLDETKYTDERLKQVLMVGAYNVQNDAAFPNSYTVNVGQVSITPDPVDEGDSDFTILTVYKTACILIGSEVKSESANAISIKDGPSAIDLRGVSGSLLALYKDICSKYQSLLDTYRWEQGNGDGTPVGTAILGPYSPGSWGVGRNGYDPY
tara:strand:+ start:302 stop:802 length:501 start_codon:yes stop_codon:yes gene_type:complete